ncbi:hypothetical protein HH308_14950 [Gordonia sp. TBRC 11910]|uniref:Phospholipase D-like protein n=1 Tax=Gordonia asplenii TaxID=2725283 RepID=A0A848KW96_9ACTN|nr:SHOCT domain-containing protein [Gordonia asplenii]NMO02512.1 hypothetical protein [Gordonia asplenii]
MWDTVWGFFWHTIVIFAFVAYLIVLWHIVTDLFRNKKTSGFAKAIWIIFLIVLPYLTAIVYLLINGSGMAHREKAAYDEAKEQSDAYIKNVAGHSPAQQIADAKALLESGAITQEEFDTLKAKALS